MRIQEPGTAMNFAGYDLNEVFEQDQADTLASMPMIVTDACKHFSDLAGEVYDWMTNQQAVGEESITDWLLYQLSRRVPWIAYEKFNRTVESRETGADWDWYFVTQRRTIGARVQAKKLVDISDQYRGLAHTNRNGLQIEMLLDSARRRNLIPMYALYYAVSGHVQTKCPRTQMGAEALFAADAQQIYDTCITPGRAKIVARALAQQAIPLSCFACCPLSAAATALEEFFRRYLPLATKLVFGDGPIGTTEPPQHVSELLRRAGSKNDDVFGPGTELATETGALLIFDLRQLEREPRSNSA